MSPISVASDLTVVFFCFLSTLLIRPSGTIIHVFEIDYIKFSIEQTAKLQFDLKLEGKSLSNSSNNLAMFESTNYSFPAVMSCSNFDLSPLSNKQSVVLSPTTSTKLSLETVNKEEGEIQVVKTQTFGNDEELGLEEEQCESPFDF